MKKYIYIFSLFTAISFVSCDLRSYDVPELSIPKYETKNEIISIATLKALAEPNIFGKNSKETNNNFGYLQHKDSLNVVDENNNRKIVSLSDIGIAGKCLKAYVVGNDESGNIYKQIYLQDETGAILIVVNSTGMFPEFPIGQEVFVELDNLCVGKYYGAYQIGAPTLSKSVSSSGTINYGMNRLTSNYFTKNIHPNNIPDTLKVQSLSKTPQIHVDDKGKVVNTDESINNILVRFDNVSFDGGGTLQFAPMVNGKPTTGTIKMNIGGVKIDVRTSGYANFAADTVPSGSGSITAILSQYFESLQITIRGREDLHFTK